MTTEKRTQTARLVHPYGPIKLGHMILAFLLLCNFVIHIPFLSQPVLDTEADYYYTAQAIGDNHFNFFTPTPEEKVPLIFILPSVLMKIFPTIIWGRIETLLAATIALLYVYLLGKFYHSSLVGLLAVILCIFFPMFAVQSIFFTNEMPQTAVFLATLYYFVTQRRRGYLISATLAVLTKETMVFMPLLLFSFACVSRGLRVRAINKKGFSENFYVLLPLCVYLLWMVLNKIFFGYFLIPGVRIVLFDDIRSIQQILVSVGTYIQSFTQQANGSMIYYAGFLLYIGYFIRHTKHKYQEIEMFCLFLLLMGFYLVLHGQFFSFGLRYVLFLYPLIFILLANIIRKYCSTLISCVSIIVICLIFGCSQWQLANTQSQSILGEAIDIRFIAQQQFVFKIIKQLKTYTTNTPIYTDYQMAHYLWNPLFGYVSTPGNNVFQVDDSKNHIDCPTCILCNQCKYPNEVLRRKKILVVLCDTKSDPLCNRLNNQMVSLISSYGTLKETVVPDWPKNSLSKYFIYEYYNPSP